MNTEEFDIQVPKELIAQTPADPRDSCRLIVLDKKVQSIRHCSFWELPYFLTEGDTLVFNNSRVIPARLKGHKVDSPMEEVTILLLSQISKNKWEALIEVGEIIVGTEIVLGQGDVTCRILQQKEKIGRRTETLVSIELSDDSKLDTLGEPPIPPYIHGYKGDPEKYQTVYSSIRGSAAAPTAGLHFTDGLLDKLRRRGINLAFVTLHVGIDTFMPVYEADPKDHKMYTEMYKVEEATAKLINETRKKGKKIITVGTTSTRTLETVTDENGITHASSGWTNIYILPGYKWKSIDGMITNFHYPRSTNLMMVSALAGTEFLKKSYEEAVKERYRFYSFGDSMLII